jgi:hypothetical protein
MNLNTIADRTLSTGNTIMPYPRVDDVSANI